LTAAACPNATVMMNEANPSSSPPTWFQRFFDIGAEEVLCLQSEGLENPM
jgi:hypothetical protein